MDAHFPTIVDRRQRGIAGFSLSRVTWMISYGPEHLEPWHANFYRGEHLVRCLRARGLDNALPRSAFPGGNHTWRTADEFMALTLPLHDLVFRR